MMFGMNFGLRNWNEHRLPFEQVPQNEVASLEAVLAHRDRVKSIHNWPLDLSFLARVAAYVVIPPVAWVAAALVENFVDSI
jgi:hypothetical protein